MKNAFLVISLFVVHLFLINPVFAEAKLMSGEAPAKDVSIYTLITETPEEGFHLAIKLSRKGVTTTQPDKQVLFMLREVYSRDPDALIAASQVIAIHFQTIAAANNYWRDARK